MTELRLSTTILPAGPAAAIFLDDEQVAQLSDKKNPPVVLTIEGVSVRVRVARMGGKNMIGLSKVNRAALGVQAGDEVDALIAVDAAERTVEVPPELAQAFAGDPAAQAAWDSLSFTHRREHAEAITGAKKPETRARRLEKVLAALRATS